MKSQLFTFIFACLLATTSYAQTSTATRPSVEGEIIYEPTPCISPQMTKDIADKLTASQANLTQLGLLPPPDAQKAVAFAWPVKKAPNLEWNSCYSISNFVDQNTASGAFQDYYCGSRTYDGHQGIDIFATPFPWYLMENNLIHVVAAAPGTIIYKNDGVSSYSCSTTGNGLWNGIYVQHADGSVAWYGHMKQNSLTTKVVGNTVSQGEFLGVVGSSGWSTGPHLHFQVYKALPYQASNLIEPFQGDCNLLNTESWWASQQPYRFTTFNTLLTHSAVPVNGCVAAEVPSMQNVFAAGATIYFARFYRDMVPGETTNLAIKKPDGTTWQQWTHTSGITGTGYYTYNYFTMPTEGPFGIWTFEATYQGITYTHSFQYGDACPAPTGTAESYSSSSATVSWNAVPGAVQYQISGAQGYSPQQTFLISNTSKTFGSNIIKPNKTYVWKVRAKCSDGTWSLYSPMRSFVTPAATRLINNQPSTDTHETWGSMITPNPVGDFLYIRLPQSVPSVTYQMMTADGRQVSPATTIYGDATLPTAHLPQGIYFVQVVSQQGSYIHKLMKL